MGAKVGVGGMVGDSAWRGVEMGLGTGERPGCGLASLVAGDATTAGGVRVGDSSPEPMLMLTRQPVSTPSRNAAATTRACTLMGEASPLTLN